MEPAFLLDSSACIPVLRGRATLSDIPAPARTAISVIVAAELWTGVEKSGAASPQRAHQETLLKVFPLVEFTDAAARHNGDIRADLEARGLLIGPLDLLIAAHARSLGATLVTGNVAEFQRVAGLKVLPWQ